MIRTAAAVGPSGTQLRRHVGSMQQLAGIDIVTGTDGLERGVRKALVRTGAGLEFSVLIDRGFDLGETRLHGKNLTWRSPVGAAHPHVRQDDPRGWLGRFPGGLLATCGLDNVGPPDESRPMHGRYSQTPARLLSQSAFFDGERYALELLGETRQYCLFGENLVLTRRIACEYGSNVIRVEDRLRNDGFDQAPFLLLYHCNFGYPLLDEGVTLILPDDPAPRDKAAKRALGSYREIHAPVPGYEEQVFLHDADAESDGVVTVGLHNARLGLGALLHYRKEHLPHLTQWKQLGEGAYVLGLEPGTSQVFGFKKEDGAGRVPRIQPGEERRFVLLFEFPSSEAPRWSAAQVRESLA